LRGRCPRQDTRAWVGSGSPLTRSTLAPARRRLSAWPDTGHPGARAVVIVDSPRRGPARRFRPRGLPHRPRVSACSHWPPSGTSSLGCWHRSRECPMIVPVSFAVIPSRRTRLPNRCLSRPVRRIPGCNGSWSPAPVPTDSQILRIQACREHEDWDDPRFERPPNFVPSFEGIGGNEVPHGHYPADP
jgi:hypothetical protein